VTTQKRLLAMSAGRTFQARRRAAPRHRPCRAAPPFRPRRVYTVEEQRVLDLAARWHGRGGKEWAEANAEAILEQARDIGEL
jgi:hypothetical protein